MQADIMDLTTTLVVVVVAFMMFRFKWLNLLFVV